MSRHDRISQAIKKEISIILHDELKDPRLGFVTVTGVELTQDHRYVRVLFSVLGSAEDYKKTKEALDSALGFIRRLIARRINLRLVPEIVFRQDNSSEYSLKIQQVLGEIQELNKTMLSSDDKASLKERKDGQDEPKKSRRLRKKV